MRNSHTTLADIARVISAKTPPSLQGDRPVTGYSLDSRTIGEGQLFIAIRGDRFDGHDFVTKALENGAVGALVSRLVQAPAGAALLEVSDVPAALKALAKNHRQAHPIPIVAVTGTNGKTTTKEVISRVLESHASICSSVGNLNSQLGMPLTLLNRLRATHQFGVFEVGMSALGEISKLCDILGPTHGVVTGIGVAHTQYLGDIENVFRAKSELVQALPTKGTLYLNAECGYHGRMLNAFGGTARRVSLTDPSADLFLRVESVDLAGVRGRLTLKGSSAEHPFSMPIPGLHMAYPALFALAVAMDLGLPLEPSLAALESCRPAPHRMSVTNRGSVTILDDSYNANPSSTEALLRFVGELPPSGQKILVLGDMLELGNLSGESHRSILSHAISTPGFDKIFLVGQNYRQAGPGIVDSKGEAHSYRVGFFESREAVIGPLKKALKNGDLVVLKASRGIGLDALVDQI